MTVRVTVWNEFRHERSDEEVRAIYPDGIHAAIAAGLRDVDGLEVRTATLDEPDQGLSAAVLAQTDVLTWWGHVAHDEVTDEVLDRVHARVLDGMGLIVLHSGHFSRIFRRLMGTTCNLKWREAAERERIWVVDPGHPIAAGFGESFVIDHEEMYGEHFDIPAPDRLVLVSWFQGGEVFRSGCCYQRGRVASSTSGRATRRTRPTSIRWSVRSSPMRPSGRASRTAPRRPSATASRSNRCPDARRATGP